MCAPLVWDIERRTVSMTTEKIIKSLARIYRLLRRSSGNKTDLQKALGSLRHLATCIRTTNHFSSGCYGIATKRLRLGERLCLLVQYWICSGFSIFYSMDNSNNYHNTCSLVADLHQTSI